MNNNNNKYGYSPVSSPRKPRTRFGTDIELNASPSPPRASNTISRPKKNEFVTLSGRHTPPPRQTPPKQEDTATIDFIQLQGALESLQKTLKHTKSLLRESEQSAEWWKSRVKVLDKRSRTLEAENKQLASRVTELERGRSEIYEDGELGSDQLSSEEDKENTKPVKKSSHPLEEIPAPLPADEQYATTIKSLITHHWNLQTELAIGAQSQPWCDCAAAKTINTLLAHVGTVPETETPGLDDDAAALKIPPHPHPELFRDMRRERKVVLKRKVEEMKLYVEGLVKENEVLEKILGEKGAVKVSGEVRQDQVEREVKEEVNIYEDDEDEPSDGASPAARVGSSPHDENDADIGQARRHDMKDTTEVHDEFVSVTS